MPFIKTIRRDRVIHIGHLDRTREDLAPSRDGPAIAVSDCPDAWRRISGANAPEVVLVNPTALWLDALAFTPDCIDEIRAWAMARRYLLPCPVFQAAWIDPKTRALRDSTRRTREEATRDCGDPAMVTEGEGFLLQPLALKRLGRWHDPLDWFNAAVTLYTREVIIPKRPLVCGIWWSEAEDAETGTAPGAQLFPEALHNFEVEDENGDMIPFAEAFPDFHPIGAKPVTLIYD